jgi:hypothetical protein
MPSPNQSVDPADDTTNTDLADAVSAIGAGLGFADEDDGGGDDLGLGDDTSAVTDVEAKSAKEVPAAVPAAETAPPAEGTPAPAAPATDAPPATWRKEASAAWAGLPSEVKQEILKRESDIFKGLESYKADANFAKGVKHVLAPYDQIMQQSGINPLQHISGLLQAHHIMATGTPQSKLAFFQKLAQDYRIDLSTLGAAPAGNDAP